MRAIHMMLTLAGVSLAACGKKPEATQAAATDTTGKTTGMQMAAQGMRMMPMMSAHLDSLGAMQPAQMAANMAAHQDLASRMMDAMGADMRGMNMQPDSAWAVLADSLRQDLGALSGLTGEALKGRMEAHIGRMRRMMTMHQGMMRM
jgi:predicted small lipoprotein YifL